MIMCYLAGRGREEVMRTVLFVIPKQKSDVNVSGRVVSSNKPNPKNIN